MVLRGDHVLSRHVCNYIEATIVAVWHCTHASCTHADAPSRDDDCSPPEEDTSSRAVVVVQLLSAVLEDSPNNRQSMVQISGEGWQTSKNGCMSVRPSSNSWDCGDAQFCHAKHFSSPFPSMHAAYATACPCALCQKLHTIRLWEGWRLSIPARHADMALSSPEQAWHWSRTCWGSGMRATSAWSCCTAWRACFAQCALIHHVSCY